MSVFRTWQAFTDNPIGQMGVFFLYLVVVFLHVQHVNGGHFSGEHKGQRSSALSHCDVQEPANQSTVTARLFATQPMILY